MNKIARRKSRSGFTIIEMIVATVLLAIGVGGLLAAFGSSIRTTALATEQQTATMLAQKQIGDAVTQAQGQFTAGESNGDFGLDYPGYRWRQVISTTDLTYVYQLAVTVTWGPSPPRERTVTTYVTQAQTYSPTTTGTTTGGAGG